MFQGTDGEEAFSFLNMASISERARRVTGSQTIYVEFLTTKNTISIDRRDPYIGSLLISATIGKVVFSARRQGRA